MSGRELLQKGIIMYKAAIIGCGRIASDFDNDSKRQSSIATHAGAYSFLPGIELSAAADIDPEKLKKFGLKWNVNKLYSSYQELLKKEAVDILSICTWSSTHLDIAKIAVEAGVKAIFCEKPITEKLIEADEMIDICNKKKVVLAIDHSRRWDMLHQQVRDYINKGKLGKIQQVSAYYTAGIANTGTHLLDLLRFLFGDVEWLWSNFEDKENVVDPSVDAYLYFKQGFGATIHGLNVKNYLIFEIDIYGTNGRLRIENSGFSAAIWDVIDHPKFSGYRCLSEKRMLFDNGLQNTMVRAIEDITNCLKNGQKPMSTGEDGRAALELICAIHESGNRLNGAKIYLPLKNRTVQIQSK